MFTHISRMVLRHSRSTLDLVQSSLNGFCEETDTGPSNCETGRKGAWTLPFQRAALEAADAPWVGAAQWCLAQCSQCSRCAFVSLSLKYTECDWFSRCDTAHLHHSPAGFRTIPFTRDAIARGMPLRGGGRGNASMRGRGRSAFQLLSGAHDRLDGAAARLRSQPEEVRALPDPASHGQPLLLIGLISGSMVRRELARCTWGRVLARMGGGKGGEGGEGGMGGEMHAMTGGGVRVKFLVAARAKDAGSTGRRWNAPSAWRHG